jgi:hypothetical protein
MAMAEKHRRNGKGVVDCIKKTRNFIVQKNKNLDKGSSTIF